MNALLLLAGIALGPRGLHLLTAERLPVVDPLVTLALVTLGALAVGRARAALVEVLTVCGAAVVLALVRFDALDLGTIAWQAGRSLEVIAAGAAIAAAGYLLMRDAATFTERRVFLLGALLALAGAADFARVAAVPLGVVGGLFWRGSRGRPESVDDDLAQVSQPLTAALLVIGGAQVQPTLAAVLIAAACASAVALIGRLTSLELTPGPLLLACTLDISQHLSPALAPLVSGAAIAILAMPLFSREHAAVAPSTPAERWA